MFILIVRLYNYHELCKFISQLPATGEPNNYHACDIHHVKSFTYDTSKTSTDFKPRNCL